MEYFIGQKLFLSDYIKDDDGEFVFQNSKKKINKNTPKCDNINTLSLVDNLIKTILHFPGEIVYMDDLNHANKSVNTTLFDEAGNKMMQLKLGELGNFKENASSHKGKKGFKKINVDNIEGDEAKVDYINNLPVFINLVEYRESFSKTKPVRSEKVAVKRKIDTNGDSAAKTSKHDNND